MINKTFQIISILLTLGCLSPTLTAAKEAGFLQDYGFIEPGFNSGLADVLNANTLSVKSGQPYDEAKDPALRKGTENWEQPQQSFFVIPAVVLGIIGIFLFLNRKK